MSVDTGPVPVSDTIVPWPEVHHVPTQIHLSSPQDHSNQVSVYHPCHGLQRFPSSVCLPFEWSQESRGSHSVAHLFFLLWALVFVLDDRCPNTVHMDLLLCWIFSWEKFLFSLHIYNPFSFNVAKPVRALPVHLSQHLSWETVLSPGVALAPSWALSVRSDSGLHSQEPTCSCPPDHYSFTAFAFISTGVCFVPQGLLTPNKLENLLVLLNILCCF